MRVLKVLDLFCGLGGFSQAFVERGHDVIGIDIVPPASIVADVRALPLAEGYRPDVILGSPPCTEFTKWKLPWHDCEPSLDLVHTFLAVVEDRKPRFWAMENVQALACFWKPSVMRVGSRYLWGDFPLFLFGSHRQAYGKSKGKVCVDGCPRKAAKVPRVISEGLCRSIESSYKREAI